MNKYLKFILILTGLVTFGCAEDFLDVNENPNSSVNADADLLFTGALVEHVNNRTQYLQFFANYYTQHVTSGNSAALITQWESYTYPATILGIWTGNTWNAYGDAESLLLAEQEALDQGKQNAAAQAKIFRMQIFFDLTQIYERIPFTEALTIGIDHPKFDEQQVVLRGILDEIDEALALIDVNEGGNITSGDLLYGGDMNKWVKYGHSLKFKILMLMSNADPSVQDEIADLVASGQLLQSADDNAKITFVDQPGGENPGWGFFDQYSSLNFVQDNGETGFEAYLTDNFLDILNDYGTLDPRTDLFFKRPDGVAEFNSIAVGDDPTSNTAFVDENIFSNVYPDYFLTYSEVELLRAEAILKGYISGNAQQAFENGVRASIQRYNSVADLRNVSVADINDYVENYLPDLSSPEDTDNAQTALEHVYVQQYVDMFARGLEGWTTWRKNGIPQLEAHPEASIDNVIRRWPYNDEEPNININFPATVPGLGESMWFENKN